MFERFRVPLYLAVIAVMATGVIAILTYQPEPVTITVLPPPPSATPAPSPTPAPILVYVTGEVLTPNHNHLLPAGSHAVEAIAAAGGLGPEADMERINLAQALRDGDHVHVPRRGEILLTPTPLGDASTSAPVYINSADAEALKRLPGVGDSLAQAILKYRESNGPFKGFEDLDKVPGVGEARIAQWQGLIVFD